MALSRFVVTLTAHEGISALEPAVLYVLPNLRTSAKWFRSCFHVNVRARISPTHARSRMRKHSQQALGTQVGWLAKSGIEHVQPEKGQSRRELIGGSGKVVPTGAHVPSSGLQLQALDCCLCLCMLCGCSQVGKFSSMAWCILRNSAAVLSTAKVRCRCPHPEPGKQPRSAKPYVIMR